MDVNKILEVTKDSDYLKYKNIEDLDINTIFKLESELINEISVLEDKYKNLDLIYFNYNKMKNKIKRSIEIKKEVLIKLSNQKEDFNSLEDKRKTIYLSREYTFYKEQTNTKKLVEKIKNLYSKIDFLKGDLKNRKLTLEYNKIKEKYRDIMIFINSEKFDNKSDVIPNNLSTEEKIKWLNRGIEEYIEKQMIFDNYIFMLENYYNEVLQKRISNISLSKESV